MAFPTAGGTPVTIFFRAQYSGSVTWKDNAGTPLAPGGTFAVGTQYTATITLTPNPGYTVVGVTANSFTVPGATSTSNSANSGTVVVAFPAPSNLFGGGNGTQSVPYHIQTAQHLQNMYSGGNSYFILDNNINLQGVNWTPIPDFTGSLDGDYKTLSNFGLYMSTKINKTRGYLAKITVP